MLPILFEFGPIKVPTFGVFGVISFVFASFILWRSLKDDYSEEDILTLTIYLLLGTIIGSRMFYLIEHLADFGLFFDRWVFWIRYPGFSLLGGFLGGLLTLYGWSKKKSWDFWLLADWATFAFIAVLLIGGLGSFIATAKLLDLYRLVLYIIILVVSLVFHRNYRKFIWYKSGKMGFVACATLAIFFLLMGLLEIIVKFDIYWEKFVWWILSLTALIFLYRRSERNWKEDLKSLKKA